MEYEEIIFNYYLQGNGWSDVRICSSGREQNIGLTHIFDCPLTELLGALVRLFEGEKEIVFYWHDEPGIYKVELRLDKNQNHLLNMNIYEQNGLGTWCETKKTLSQNQYLVKLQEFSANVYGEILKLNELMRIKSYSESRKRDYPNKQVQDFIKAYKKKYVSF